MIGPIWTGLILVLALASLVLSLTAGSITGIVLAACFLIFGGSMLWRNNRFSPRRMRRP